MFGAEKGSKLFSGDRRRIVYQVKRHKTVRFCRATKRVLFMRKAGTKNVFGKGNISTILTKDHKSPII